MPPPRNKRPPPSSTSSLNNSSTLNSQMENILKKPKKKKTRTETSVTAVEEQLEPAKEFIKTNSKSFPLDHAQLSEFLYKAYGNADIFNTSLSFTQDTALLISMLEQIIPQILERNLKSRIGRIIEKLRNKSADNTTHQNRDSTTEMSFSEESSCAEE